MVITFQRWVTGISILGFIALLAACGGGGSSDKPTPTSVATSSTPTVSSSALSSSTISSELSSSSPESSSSSSAMPALMGGAIQGHPLNIATVVSTFAGGDDIFYRPDGITTDGTNLYVADTGYSAIRKIVIATGEVSTIAGTEGSRGSEDGIGAAARFNDPSAITTDGTNLYVTDSSNYIIRKIVIATGTVTTLAGTVGVWGSADGTGAAARFSLAFGITTDGANLYVADSNNYTIRKIVIATGVVTTLAGTAQVRGNTDGIGAGAIFFFPEGITTDGTSLYVDDTVNNTIRKIVIATGEVTTLVESVASGITTDGTNLYVAGDTIRKITIATGAITTLAGTEGVCDRRDGVGTAASFCRPYGITTDGFDLFVTDTVNNTIRKIH